VAAVVVVVVGIAAVTMDATPRHRRRHPSRTRQGMDIHRQDNVPKAQECVTGTILVVMPAILEPWSVVRLHLDSNRRVAVIRPAIIAAQGKLLLNTSIIN